VTTHIKDYTPEAHKLRPIADGAARAEKSTPSALPANDEEAKAVTERKAAEERFGQVCNTVELAAEFEVLSFLAPFIEVRRKSDGAQGTLRFIHRPRFYYDWRPNSSR
jgi:hypothetical protein